MTPLGLSHRHHGRGTVRLRTTLVLAAALAMLLAPGPSAAAAKETRKPVKVSLGFEAFGDANQVVLALAVEARTPRERANDRVCLFGRVGTAYAPPYNYAPPEFAGSGVLTPLDPDTVVLRVPVPPGPSTVGGTSNRHYGEFRGEVSRKVVRRKGRKYICQAQADSNSFIPG
jgi:hypothetical protein